MNSALIIPQSPSGPRSQPFSHLTLATMDLFLPPSFICPGFPWWLSGKESACDAGDAGSIPGSGRSPGEGNGHPLQYSCLENSSTLRPHGLQPARLCYPWHFPGKNTGVGCHFLHYFLPDPGIEPTYPVSPALAGGFFLNR